MSSLVVLCCVAFVSFDFALDEFKWNLLLVAFFPVSKSYDLVFSVCMCFFLLPLSRFFLTNHSRSAPYDCLWLCRVSDCRQKPAETINFRKHICSQASIGIFIQIHGHVPFLTSLFLSLSRSSIVCVCVWSASFVENCNFILLFHVAPNHGSEFYQIARS